MKVLLVLVAALAVSRAEFGRSFDTLVDLARLYRMQNLQRYGDVEDDYMTDELESRSSDDWTAPYGDAMYKDPLFGGTHLRDQEHIEQSSLYGSQSVSGGTAEGKPNQKQVKTDKPLPAYCNPPNPCPIGYTAKNNCVEDFNNSADHNKALMEKQDCPCDTEHMFACPKGRGTVSSKGKGEDQAAIKEVMAELQKLGVDDMDSLLKEETRRTLVAKKSPELSRNKRSSGEYYKFNPYLQGVRKRVGAKKAPGLAYRHQ